MVNHRLALLGGIVGFREQHAIITSGLLVFADTARLWFIAIWSVFVPSCRIGGFLGVPWAYRVGQASSESLQGREQLYLIFQILAIVYHRCICGILDPCALRYTSSNAPDPRPRHILRGMGLAGSLPLEEPNNHDILKNEFMRFDTKTPLTRVLNMSERVLKVTWSARSRSNMRLLITTQLVSSARPTFFGIKQSILCCPPPILPSSAS